MKKESQSLLDFINTFPNVVNFRSAPICNKEAKTLFEIWKNGKNIIPDSADPVTVASLATKGLIRTKAGSLSNPVVDITDKGKQVIRNIILYSEKSSFEKSSKMEFDYENIYNIITNGISKVASIQTKNNNWLGKAWNC